MSDSVGEAAVRAALATHGKFLDDGLGGKSWAIAIFCQEASHAEKRWDIGQFYLRVHPGYPVPSWNWEPTGKRGRGGQAGARRAVRRAGQPGMSAFVSGPQYLIGDRPVPQIHRTGEFVGRGVEERYPLKCGLCNLSAPRRRRRGLSRNDDLLQVALDEYAIAGVSQIPLRVLVAILTSG